MRWYAARDGSLWTNQRISPLRQPPLDRLDNRLSLLALSPCTISRLRQERAWSEPSFFATIPISIRISTFPDRGLPMAVKEWHGGKIVLLWVVAAAATFVLIVVGVGMADCYDCTDLTNTYGQLIAVLGAVGPFIVSVVVTWRWLGGRERSG